MGPVSRANYRQGFHQTSTMDMKSANTFRPGRQIALLLALFALMNPVLSEIPSTNPTSGDDDSTVVYPADYFNQFFPVSANDMLSRIPGIDLALRGGRGGRGLGSGAGEILINGQRITGKNNGGRSALARISADQVEHIEIIRGTSTELDIRGGGQIVNVVLLDEPSRSSTTVQLRSDVIQDGTLTPAARISRSGQNGDLNYLFNLEADPRYRAWESREFSFTPDGELTEVRRESRTRDETQLQASMNLGYTFPQSVLQFNALYETLGEVPDERYRTITQLTDNSSRVETESNLATRDAWELGGDFEYDFNDAGTYRFLFIVNDRDSINDRNRFQQTDGLSTRISSSGMPEGTGNALPEPLTPSISTICRVWNWVLRALRPSETQTSCSGALSTAHLIPPGPIWCRWSCQMAIQPCRKCATRHSRTTTGRLMTGCRWKVP